jgi:hypothetical protein
VEHGGRPVTPNVLDAVSGCGAQSLWKSTDGGESWTDVLAGTSYEAHAEYRFVNDVSLDPTDHLHLVVATLGGVHGAVRAELHGRDARARRDVAHVHRSAHGASLDDDETWTDLPTPPQLAKGHDGGIPFLALRRRPPRALRVDVLGRHRTHGRRRVARASPRPASRLPRPLRA